jgi:arylsulfatase
MLLMEEKMKRILSLAILFIVFICWPSSLLAKETRPNILLIVVDDMGFSDIGPFGGGKSVPRLWIHWQSPA